MSHRRSVRSVRRLLDDSARSNAVSRSRASSAVGAVPAPACARTTTNEPTGIRSSRSLMRCRSRRRTAFRVTAPPTALPTANPDRVRESGSIAPPVSTCTPTKRLPPRTPRRVTAWWSRVRRKRFWGGSMRETPPVANSAIRRGSGGQPRTALATTGADDRPARPGSHAQPEAVGSRPPAIVRLEGALHVRAPSSTGAGGGFPTIAQACGYAYACSGSLVGPTHGTWRGGTGSNRASVQRESPAVGENRPADPGCAVQKFVSRHAGNIQITCGHWLNPSRGVVSVPGSTSVVATMRLPGK